MIALVGRGLRAGAVACASATGLFAGVMLGALINSAGGQGQGGLPVLVRPTAYVNAGYQQITSLGSATSLTVPAGATIAEICAETSAVRYRADGTNPTASVGIPVAAGACFQFSGSLAAMSFIQQAAGAVLNVDYYK